MPAYTTTLRGNEPVAEGTAAFRFARPEGFAFRAGQSMSLTLVDPPETDARGATRVFSVASAPFEEDLVIATRMRDSAFKRVLRGLAPGAPIKLRGPNGVFTLPDDALRPVVFLAGGIGITPFVSMLRQEHHERSARPRQLLYSNRRPEDAPFLAELQAMAQEGSPLTLAATMTDMAASRRPWNGATGMIDGAFIARHADLAARPVCYVAGPPAMVTALKAALRAAGVPDADLRSDEFFGY